ncbi:MAG TPA: STAS domain-containing protein [Spirochaetota bacterium]|nr:STAS domain-containing protein [Spirochaetota bacterium]HPC39800.1 STAS domain-containing protein [Spirochaetota bacterium]HPL17764.1 STAS domain-containing protein [Spirochaetota bacterium]HQF09847.1 STAS domain-containing protein [Spirochaetota bacterium]HQH98497.1 STAS domain-containing protein [Spirochaetota bacterium]
MGSNLNKSISVGIKGDVVLIVAVGEMRAPDCFAMNEYLLPYLDHVGEPKKIYIDLSRCDYMDSTFIGVIVALTKRCRTRACDSIRIVNPSDKATLSMRKLVGIDEIVVVENPDLGDIPVFRLVNDPTTYDSRKNIELMFEAHQALSRLSERNRKEFKDLLEELRRVLKSKLR